MIETTNSEEEMQKAINRCTDSLQRTANAIANGFNQSIPLVKKVLESWQYSLLKSFGSKRVVHLAFHAKKKRTRKKNRNRLLKTYFKALKGDQND